VTSKQKKKEKTNKKNKTKQKKHAAGKYTTSVKTRNDPQLSAL